VSWRACYSAATPPEAHLVKGFLEQRGVPCLLRHEGPTVYPAPALGLGVHVLVPSDWLPVALKLVERPAPPRREPGPAVVLPLRPRKKARR
jgi:hypothetical protein